MGIEFRNITDYPRGFLRELLIAAYSFNPEYQRQDDKAWVEFDNFFYDHPSIAEKYGFVTMLDGEPIGHISWDPRNLPAYAVIGHNCILPAYKGKGYGRMQLAEAVRRICLSPVEKIVVSTNSDLLPAQKNYESVGFKLIRRDDSVLPNLFYEYLPQTHE